MSYYWLQRFSRHTLSKPPDNQNIDTKWLIIILLQIQINQCVCAIAVYFTLNSVNGCLGAHMMNKKNNNIRFTDDLKCPNIYLLNLFKSKGNYSKNVKSKMQFRLRLFWDVTIKFKQKALT